MDSVLIVHASRHGGSAGIAERIGETLRAAGLDAVVEPAADLPDPRPFDGCVVGAGVYMGSWVKEGTAYLETYAYVLAGKPLWLFSSGPLPGSSKNRAVPTDPIELALGPASGPGSAGRRRIEELARQIGPREHRVFQGAFDPALPPQGVAERFVRIMPGSKNILPTGDFRDWPAIEAWARDIAASLAAPAAVG